MYSVTLVASDSHVPPLLAREHTAPTRSIGSIVDVGVGSAVDVGVGNAVDVGVGNAVDVGVGDRSMDLLREADRRESVEAVASFDAVEAVESFEAKMRQMTITSADTRANTTSAPPIENLSLSSPSVICFVLFTPTTSFF